MTTKGDAPRKPAVGQCLRVKIMHDTSLVLLLNASHSLIGDKMPGTTYFLDFPPRHLGSQIVTFNLHVAQLLPQVKNRKLFE